MRPLRVLTYNIQFGRGTDRTIDVSWPSPLPLMPLDHILINGDLAVIRSGLWRGPGVRIASDHAPVFAEIVAT
jgi:endonuclease/exonuclease/phosphatase family metal-dependent hydrolase